MHTLTHMWKLKQCIYLLEEETKEEGEEGLGTLSSWAVGRKHGCSSLHSRVTTVYSQLLGQKEPEGPQHTQIPNV